MAASKIRRTVGCLGLLCLPVAFVLTLVFMSRNRQIAYYVGAGAVALLGLLLLLLWLGWVSRDWLARRAAAAGARGGNQPRPYGTNICQLCSATVADFYCRPHHLACCKSCVQQHHQPGVCRFWLNPECQETLRRFLAPATTAPPVA